MPGLDQLLHLPVEEGEQQRADMRAVNVGVGHDDDLVIAELAEIELVVADAGAERGDERSYLGARQHLVEARPLDIEDLAAQGEHGLEGAVARLLGAAAGRVALDQEQLGLGGIALLAIGELAGKRGEVERALAAGELAGFSRGLARGRRLDDLLNDVARLARILLEPARQRVGHDALDHGAHFRGHELVLGLAREFGIGHLDRKHASEPLAGVVAGQRHLLLLGDAGLRGIGVHGAGQRRAEARKMRAAVALRDVVGEAEHVLVVAVVPPQRGLDGNFLLLLRHDDRLLDQRVLGAIEVAHESAQAPLVTHLLELRLDAAIVRQQDAHARIQERKLAQAMLERRIVELDHGEGLAARHEGDARAGLGGRVADRLERRLRHPVGEAHEMLLAVAPDGEIELGGERIDDRDADAMQAARHLVGVLVELSAGMELRHDDFGGRDAFAFVDLGRDAAPIVLDSDRAVGVQGDGDLVAEARERLVDRVVHDLVDHVMQTRAVIGVADIHARPLAHGVEALQHFDQFRAVLGGSGILAF